MARLRSLGLHNGTHLAQTRAFREVDMPRNLRSRRLGEAIAKDGNPSFETVMEIVGAFGVRLSAQAAAD